MSLGVSTGSTPWRVLFMGLRDLDKFLKAIDIL